MPVDFGSVSDRHMKQRDSIIAQLLKLLLGLWGDWGSARDPERVVGIAAKSVLQVMPATLRSRELSRSYNATMIRALGVKTPTLDPIRNPYPRSNTTAFKVYQRPAETFIWNLSQGKTVEEAQNAASTRLEAIISDDIAAADRDETNLIYSKSGFALYRRVIHPEMSRSGTCGLCAVASQRVYTHDNLLPLHRGCHCDTIPLAHDKDPGLELNDEDLKRIYHTAGSTYAEDLLNTRITINEHGELGPILSKQGDHFRDPKDVGGKPFTPSSYQEDIDRTHAALAEANEKWNAALSDARDAENVPGAFTKGTDAYERRVLLRDNARTLGSLAAIFDSQEQTLRKRKPSN